MTAIGREERRVRRSGVCRLMSESRVECVAFFFFQAEDGIRDRTVTGVQTCALPISLWPRMSPDGVVRGAAPASRADVLDSSKRRIHEQPGSGVPVRTAVVARRSKATGSIGEYFRFGTAS